MRPSVPASCPWPYALARPASGGSSVRAAFCMKRTRRPRHHSKLREMTIVSCRMPDYDCMDQYPALVGTGPLNGVRQLGEGTPEDVVLAVLLRLTWARLKASGCPQWSFGRALRHR